MKMDKYKLKLKQRVSLIALLIVLIFCINCIQTQNFRSGQNKEFKVEIEGVVSDPVPAAMRKYLSNAEMDASLDVTGTGTEADPYIVSVQEGTEWFDIEIKNLTDGHDSVIVRDVILRDLDVECGKLVLERTSTLRYGIIKADNTSLINNSYLIEEYGLSELIIYSNSIRLLNNRMPSHQVYIFTVEAPYTDIRSNVIHSIHLQARHNPTILKDNHFIGQQPVGDPNHPLPQANITNNYFENYADFYPEATHDGEFWNKPFGHYPKATCKSPIMNTPAIPILKYTTNLRQVHENLSNTYWYDKNIDQEGSIDLTFYSPETVLYRVYMNGTLWGTAEDTVFRATNPIHKEYNFRVEAVNTHGMSGLSNTIKITMVEVSEPEPDNMPIIMNVIFTLVGAASAIIVIVIVKYAKKKKEEGKVKDVKMDSEFDL